MLPSFDQSVLEGESQEPYRRIRVLGEGAMGRAYLVESKLDGQQYVMKRINLNLLDKVDQERASKEAELHSQVKHRNIIALKEIYSTNSGRLCLVMEFAEQGDIDQMLKKRQGKPLSQDVILNCFVQICLGLRHLHQMSIVHRDLKGANIFIRNGIFKIGDFGISKVMEQTMSTTRAMVGTPYYLSPQLIDGKPYSFRTDIWSLGVILYNLCSLRLPFEAPSLPLLALKIMRGSFPPITGDYSKELKALVLQLLQVDQRKRPTVDQILGKPYLKKYVNSMSGDQKRSPTQRFSEDQRGSERPSRELEKQYESPKAIQSKRTQAVKSKLNPTQPQKVVTQRLNSQLQIQYQFSSPQIANSKRTTQPISAKFTPNRQNLDSLTQNSISSPNPTKKTIDNNVKTVPQRIGSARHPERPIKDTIQPAKSTQQKSRQTQKTPTTNKREKELKSEQNGSELMIKNQTNDAKKSGKREAQRKDDLKDVLAQVKLISDVVDGLSLKFEKGFQKNPSTFEPSNSSARFERQMAENTSNNFERGFSKMSSNNSSLDYSQTSRVSREKPQSGIELVENQLDVSVDHSQSSSKELYSILKEILGGSMLDRCINVLRVQCNSYDHGSQIAQLLTRQTLQRRLNFLPEDMFQSNIDLIVTLFLLQHPSILARLQGQSN